MPLISHPSTGALIHMLTAELPQSVLLGGSRGVGLLTIAKEIAGKQLAAVLYPQNAKELRDDDNGTITVEMIRRLYEQTRAKYTSRQVIIVDNADRMSRGAQSAFLKLLEEPGLSIHFILTSHAPQKLLSTIRSRVQHHIIQPVATEQIEQLLDNLAVTDTTKRAQLKFIAAGLPAEIIRLSEDEEYFKTKAGIMGDARTFLQGDPYARLLIVQKYQASREHALILIDSAMQIARRTLSAKPQQNLVSQLELLLQTRELIESNHNVRLQLTRTVL